jgi:uncharacterized repeat protein (TIGR01451 family)
MATTSSSITVAGAGSYLLDLDVFTDITHTFGGDLDITVTSPAGTVVTLTTDSGAGTDNVFAGTLWDDDAGDTNPPGPVTDNVFTHLVAETPLVAEEALAAFIGEDPNGIWTIDVFDDAGGDIGSLSSWSLQIVTLPAAPAFDPVVSATSTDTPLPIADSTATASTIGLAGAASYVCRVQVTTDITHTFAGDLDITITSPAGTVMTLTTDSGAGNDNVFAGTLWDDDAGDTNPPGPVSDNVFANLVLETPLVPEEALAAFIGEDPNGTWALDLFDDAGGDVGSLNSWEVAVTTCACGLPDADLEIAKTGVLAGNQATWTLTVTNNGPADATNVVVTDPLAACSTYVSDDCGGANLPPWTWNIGNLANGATTSCNVVVDVSACPSGSLTNTASVSGDQNDPTPANNAATGVLGIANLLEIPTLGRTGLLLLALALALLAPVVLRRSS